MIAASDLQSCRGSEGVHDLFRRLGYPVEPVEIDGVEWRRAGIALPWNGEARVVLLSRLSRLDLFLLEGDVSPEQIRLFAHSYATYNQATKSVILKYDADRLSIFDVAGSVLRRLDVDLEAPSLHALDRLNLLALPDGGEYAAPRLFERALDREAVTRQFFLRFRGAVRDLAAELRRSCPSETEEAINGEALLILSRLLFLSFIQEKGWLNGERRFLIDRAERAVRERCDFFATVLLPLFFGCLNTPPPERDDVSRHLGAVPYLNGGLFEPSPFERRNLQMCAGNDLLLQILEDVFEKFDFRIDESDTSGTSVDPEMLGKVFESLMAEEERAASGSFYTPKEIVDVLTARAIAEWIAGADFEMRDALIAVMNGQPAAPAILDRAEDIVARLQSMTILDPACGSGAFLLSALHAIERCILALRPSPPEHLRQQIVERSLHAVDLKPEAVRLCELRLWLAIVAGSETTLENVRPLPNLDRNILQGNSLLSPLDFLGSARGDIYRQWAWGLRAQQSVIERYRSAPRAERPALSRLIRSNDLRLACELLSRAIDADEAELQAAMAPRRDLFGGEVPADLDHCRVLQRRIGENRRALASAEEGELGFFSFDVHFAPVLARGGFDVVLGNPPWVRSSRIDPESRATYRERYRLFAARGAGAGFHQPDVSVAFFERATSLTAPNGIVAMLMPAKIANAAYAAGLREFIESETEVLAVADWSDDQRRWFSADTFPLGLVIRKSKPGDGCVEIAAGEERFAIPRQELSTRSRGSEWALVPPAAASILRSLRERCAPLEETLCRRPVMGVKTGDNRAFFLDAGELDSGWLTTASNIRIPTEFVCRCVRGRDLRRWSVSESHWMLWPPASGWRDLPPWLQQLALERRIEPHKLRLAYVRPEHVGIKVAWKDVSRGMAASVLPDAVNVAGHTFPLIPNQTLYSVDAVSLDEAYVIAAVLNSVIAGALLLSVAERAKDAHYRYFGRTVGAMPLPELGGRWDPLLRASRAAHRTGTAPPELDGHVADLYEITPSELEVLRAYVARRLGPR